MSQPASSQKPRCASCDSENAAMKCGACAAVSYCDRACQTAHWKAGHKLQCADLTAKGGKNAGGAAASVAVGVTTQPHKQKPTIRDDGLEALLAAIPENTAVAGRLAEQQREEDKDKPLTERGNCWTCGADNPSHSCNRCKVTKYCGVACQTENWPIHKGRCKELKNDASLAAATRSYLGQIKTGARRSQQELDGILASACRLGRVVDIERIIAAGGRVNSHDSQGVCNSMIGHKFSPAHWAAQEGHARAIGVLMRHGALVDARTEKGVAACDVAAQNGQIKAVAALLEHGAKIDSRNDDGLSALYWASQNNHPEVVALLLSKGAQVDLPNQKGGTPRIVSAGQGFLAVVKLLLQHGAQIDGRSDQGGGALYMACQEDRLEIVALLLEKGAQVDLASNKGATPLLVACIQGHEAVAKLLLEHGAQVDLRAHNGTNALLMAAQTYRPEIMALLLQKGCQVDLADDKGYTALIISAQQGHEACVRLLLQAGADPLRPAPNGFTPMSVAQGNHPKVVALLQARIAEMARERS